MVADAARSWLITGCSSGFGRMLAQKALERGDRVALTARDPDKLRALAEPYGDAAICLQLDVTKPETVRSALATALDRFGRLDILVNNAGFGMQAAAEEASDEAVRAMFDVNFFGPLDVIRAALPALRAQGSGHIINISSVGGRSSAPLIGLYSASKFALEGLSASLAMELASFGIKVTSIEPGAFATGFADAIQYPAGKLAAYEPLHAGFAAVLADLHFADPAGCVDAILAIAGNPEPPQQLIAGSHAVAIVEAILAGQQAEIAQWRGVSEAADKS